MGVAGVLSRCLWPHGWRANAPSPLNLQACFLSDVPHCLAGLDANTKQYLGVPLAVAPMLNAAAFAFWAAAWQRAGASAAVTFLRATLPALPAIGFPAQLAKSACLTQPWGAGLGDAGGVLGLGDGTGLAPGGTGDGLVGVEIGGEGLGAGAGLGDGLTTGAVDAARGWRGDAGDWAALVVRLPCRNLSACCVGAQAQRGCRGAERAPAARNKGRAWRCSPWHTPALQAPRPLLHDAPLAAYVCVHTPVEVLQLGASESHGPLTHVESHCTRIVADWTGRDATAPAQTPVLGQPALNGQHWAASDATAAPALASLARQVTVAVSVAPARRRRRWFCGCGVEASGREKDQCGGTHERGTRIERSAFENTQGTAIVTTHGNKSSDATPRRPNNTGGV
jgi:hypothetical protein